MDAIGGYRILGEIARGGMGAVYRAQDAGGQQVALKVLLNQTPEGVQRFKREAELAHGLVHPHVVSVRDFGVFGKRPFLVMDYVEGEDLMARLKRDGPLPEVEARRLFRCLAEGLQAAHARGVIHRDVKPQNVLLAGAEVYLGDFGLARSGPSTLTATGELVGTPAYMSPEQARGEGQEVGFPADVYGFGATLYTALSGRAPFRGATLYAVLDQVMRGQPEPLRSLRRKDLSPGLEGLVSDCLRKEAGERPTVQEVLERLEASGGAASPRRPLLAVASAVALAGATLGAALTWGLSSAAKPTATLAANPTVTLTANQERSLAATFPTPDPTRVQGMVSEALELRAQGRLDAARSRAERALDLDPAHHQARLVQGVIAFETGNWALAERLSDRLEGAEKALRAEGHYYRGRALFRHWLDLPPSTKNDALYAGAAREAFAKAHALEPSARALAWLGQAHLRLGDRAAAVKCLAEAREIGRHDPHVFVLNHALEPYRRTQDDYRLRAATFESHMIVASYQLQAGEEQQGLQGLAQGAALRPCEQAGVMSCRADALVRRSRSTRDPARARRGLELARELLDRALSLVPARSRAMASLLASRGRLLFRLGQSEEGGRDFKLAVGIDSSEKLRGDLARFLAERVADLLPAWDVEGMERLLDEAKALAPDEDRAFHGQHLALLARAKAMRCDFAEAEAFFTASLAVANPSHLKPEELSSSDRKTVIRALVFRGRSRVEAATIGHPTALGSPDLRRALEVGAEPYLRSLLVQALRQEGRAEDAQEELRRLKVALRSVPADLVYVAIGIAEGREEVLAKLEQGNPYSLGAALGKVAGLEELVKAAPPTSREHPAMILGLARRGREAKTWQGAAEALDKLLGQHPLCCELRFERGLLRARGGQFDLALGDLERAHKEHPLAERRAEIAAEVQRVTTLRDTK